MPGNYTFLSAYAVTLSGMSYCIGFDTVEDGDSAESVARNLMDETRYSMASGVIEADYFLEAKTSGEVIRRLTV